MTMTTMIQMMMNQRTKPVETPQPTELLEKTPLPKDLPKEPKPKGPLRDMPKNIQPVPPASRNMRAMQVSLPASVHIHNKKTSADHNA